MDMWSYRYHSRASGAAYGDWGRYRIIIKDEAGKEYARYWWANSQYGARHDFEYYHPGVNVCSVKLDK